MNAIKEVIEKNSVDFSKLLEVESVLLSGSQSNTTHDIHSNIELKIPSG
ncbi:hypothetical protein [Bacillus sp. 2205SS5-2]